VTCLKLMQFLKLIEEIIEAETPESLPSIMTNYLEVLLNMNGYEGPDVLRSVMKEAEKGDAARQELVVAAFDYVLEFMEAF